MFDDDDPVLRRLAVADPGRCLYIRRAVVRDQGLFLFLPDRDGKFENVVLGHRTLAEYELDTNYLGALIGRFGNRIAGGSFDLLGEIYAFLEQAVATAKKKGIQRSKIIIDPGIGFGKTVRHNLLLLKDLTNFKTMGLPVLIGPSRKAFVRKLLKPDHLTDIDPQLPMVETGTQAAVAVAALNGADIVRVHNVAGTLATLKIVAATQAAKLA